MMNILNKISFHYTYVIMAIGLILTGYFVNLIIFTSLIAIHELGHIIISCLFKYKIDKIIFYPYGGLTKLDMPVNTNINKDLLVSISGIIFQEVFFVFIFFLFRNGLIREYTYNLFVIYNKNILLFNILPIIPLDGSKIVNLLLSKMVNFNLANILTIVISFFSLILILVLNIFENNYTTIMIIGILLQNIIVYYNKLSFIYYRFILERYLYDIKYKKTKIINNKNKMYKNRNHIFKINDCLISEKDYLCYFFRKKG